MSWDCSAARLPLNCSNSSSAPTAIPAFARWYSPGHIRTDSSATLICNGCKKTVRSFRRSAAASPAWWLRSPTKFGRNKLTRWLASKTPLMGAIQLDHMHETLVRMTTSSTIFVAALNGSALGLGAEISWACDLRLMAKGDYFIGHLEVLLGFPPGSGGTQRLPRLIGSHRALVAILEGRPFPAEEALAIGMIDEIVPRDLLIPRAVERASYLAARPTEAIGAIKRAVNVGGSLSMAEGLQLESAEFLAALPQPQAQEIMLRYLRDTAETGELPLYQPGGYAAALQHGNASVGTTTRT
jgi:enoyl-CoA hydratase